ncbi:uncharacterized protein LOC129800765 [Phlebotomus papatasi]|uniref:uncharacterized protein LOC129800765 n=1 Tax=Phlebotomus papatasi TaxID=29031 RepID=UPI002483D390|nr:uncharacterized protein LOC129800765 [Phlebotomus papatasi]XP_055701357.1 uncharacterized protein LOC129800765 [Phlebotomus papatasi]
MVRVLSVYQFEEGSELTIADDINASCLVPPDRIALATSGLDVEIRSLANDSTKDFFTFPAVDEIEEIHYCRNGNYLLMIESKNDNRNIKWRIVRIYCNWDADPGHKSKSMAILRARIAGKVTPSDKYINSEDVEMIELPLKTQPRCVACCQVTGNIAIVAGNKVLFYQFKSCKTDTGRHNYIDFVEVPFFVELSFSPQKISLAEGVVACMNDFTFNLFKITEVYEPSISVDISDESFSSDASGSLRINTKDTLDFRTICKHSTINRQKFRVDVGSDCDENGTNIGDIRPEIVHDMLIILRSLQDSETLSKYTIKPLLQLRLPCPVSQKPIFDSFKSMSINPLYMRREMCPEKNCENIFGSKYSRNFVSVALVVATQQDGYLYQFYNNDEWRQNTDILASYSFTAPIVDLVLKDSVLHVLTETGVETYTLRIGQKIFYSPCEYFLNYSTTLDVIGPNFNDPICLLGLHSIPATEKILSSHGNLIIFSKDRRTNSSWKVKLLQEPRTEILYRNIEGYALKHRAENPKVFLHLMGEIHIMIRTANELARVAPLEKMKNQVPLTVFSDQGDKEVENLFLESCRTLADFFVLSANEEEYYMALPYYLMGKLSVADIFNRCIQFEQLGVYSMGGIIYTLKQLFLRLQPGSEEMTFISTSMVRSTSMPDNNNGNEMRLDRDGGFMKILFDLLLKYAPRDITSIALQSSTFLNRMGDHILDFLEGCPEKTNEEKLCVALQLVRKKRASVARNLIESIDPGSLLAILSKNWTILFETSMNHKNGHSIVIFSEFTEHCLLMSQLDTIQRLTASVLKYLLVNLQVLPFEVLLKMLIDFTSLRIGFAGSDIGKNILMLTLELYLMDYAEQKKLCADQSESTDSASFIVTTSTISNATRSGQNQESSRKMSSSMASDVDTALSIFGSTATGKALKILVRSHLGFLSSQSGTQKKDSDSKEASVADFEIPEKEIDALFESLKKTQEILKEKCGAAVDEPILFMDKRWNYLNLMPPLQANFLDYLVKPKREDIQENPMELDTNVACLKLQALLASGELPEETMNEVSQFICSHPNLIGIESIISCLLHVPECTEFLVNVCPQCVLEFGKDRFSRNEDWAFLINCLQVQTSRAGDATESNGGLLLFYHRLLKEVLEYIANTKPLETVMKIFPEHEITQIPDNVAGKTHPGHHPHEQSAFIQYIRVSVEKERARKLKQVIVAKSNTLSAKLHL